MAEVAALAVKTVVIVLDPLNAHRPHVVLVHLDQPGSGPLFYAYATRAEAEAKVQRLTSTRTVSEPAAHPTSQGA